jgi:hypothetical protein
MVDSLKGVTLYSSTHWWLGGEIARQLSGDTAFATWKTRFPTYSYDVNSVADYQQSGFIGLDKKNHLTLSQTTPTYTGHLSLADNSTGRLTRNVTIGATPDIPEQYADQVSHYEMTDADYSTLMAQPEFIIPRVAMGLKITTDGHGNAQSVAINPTSVNLLNAYGDVSLPNRTELTARAVYKVDPSDSPYATNTLKPEEAKRLAMQSAPSAPLPVFAVPKSPVQRLFSQQSAPSSPTADRLGSLFGNAQSRSTLAVNANLTFASRNQPLGLQQAQQLAAQQANLVVASPGFRQTLAELASSSQQAPVEPPSSLEQITPSLEKIMDGQVAMVPQVTVYNPFANQRGPSDKRLDITEGFLNAAERRSKGGYLPTYFMLGEKTDIRQKQFLAGSGDSGDMSFQQGQDAGTGANGEPMNEQERRRRQRS